MQLHKDISFGWRGYLFDLYAAEDRLKYEKQFAPNNSVDMIAKITAAKAINFVVNNRRTSPEISNETLERVLSEMDAYRVAILDAHGEIIDGVWHYSENREELRDDWKCQSIEEINEESILSRALQFIRLPDGFIFPAGEGKIL